MKKFMHTWMIFLLICLLPSLSFADNGEEVNMIVKKDEVIQKDFFAAGSFIRNHGEIRGDVFAAGEEFENTGTVMGDILAIGGNSRIGGQVKGDVRIAGGNVTITGDIGKNATAFSGNFLLAEGAAVDGSINVFAGTVVIDGVVGGDLRAGSGTVQINGLVKGDVRLHADQIRFGPQAKIEGNLLYTSEKKITIPEGVVSGSVEYKQPYAGMDERIKKAEEGLKTFNILWKAVGIIAYLIIAAILVLVFGNFMDKTAITVERKPWHAVGIGLVGLIVTPIAAILLMFTVIGIPLGVISLVLYGLVLYLAKLPGALWLGKVILKNEGKPLLPMLLGVFILMLVSYVPYLGGFVSLVAILFGIGAYLYNIREAIENSRKPKIVEE